MAQPNKPGKAMSSRLATMKFMQRGGPSPASSPSTPSAPLSKRQRLTNGSYNSTPASTPRSETHGLETPESQSREALSERGDSKWYLSFKEPATSLRASPSLQIISAGYSTLDVSVARSSESDGDSNAQLQGRRSFGKFNKKFEKQQNSDLESSDSEAEGSSSDDAEDEGEDATGASALIKQARKEATEKARTERRAKRKADEAETRRLAEERRKKHVKLNNLSSISGGGGTPSRSRGAGRDDMVCFKCGDKGHAKRDCPR